ncbi:aspartate aminotransferase family protein [Cryobacterium sp. TMT2-23]|uniref:aspartate aminotransferase family protein n=1 Tax=Cryobacterium sp. TMT2-23 TaxID=1259252 RepID=UPI00141BB239|nr:aminotransferase class III-fold pyridoxal phosphate-dependent enzyme [Cryobacterium sp. TMT2-23]
MTSMILRDTYDLSISAVEFERAKQSIPGGLVSLVRRRDHQAVFAKGQGAYLWDVDGNKYIDCVMAHGPVLLGHADPAINAAAKRSLDNGVQFGGSYIREAVLAEAALRQLPFADRVTFMTTGTEAVQLAIRVARTTTGRNLIVKFQGHFHGWIDPVYVNIPGYDPQGPADACPGEIPGSVKIEPAVEGATPPVDVLVTTWNDLDAFTRLMDAVGDQVAAVIMEPLVTGFGTYCPSEGYLQGLKDVSRKHGTLVIYDEIVTGFRVSPSGASGLVGVTPDIATYAKGIANGFPMSMLAGTREAMACIEDGRVPAAGTYSGTPASLEAAIASLARIEEEGTAFYSYLDTLGARLKNGLEEVGRTHSIPIVINQIGSLAQMLYGDIADPQSVHGVYSSDKGTVTRLCEAMIARGVYTTRKGLFFLSRAHTEADIDTIIRTFDDAVTALLKSADALP